MIPATAACCSYLVNGWFRWCARPFLPACNSRGTALATAVQELLDAYEEVNKSQSVAPTRPCITHSNFMSHEAILQAARLGVVVDIQPAWLYLDTRTLAAQFGYDRLRYFQPLRTLFAAGVIAGGGSDHMQKIGSFRSINPYNPFLAIAVAVTRRARGFDKPLHPEEALSREQAIRFYTINNAHLLFLEDRIGSLEPGKQADFVVIDRDLLTCPEDQIKERGYSPPISMARESSSGRNERAVARHRRPREAFALNEISS